MRWSHCAHLGSTPARAGSAGGRCGAHGPAPTGSAARTWPAPQREKAALDYYFKLRPELDQARFLADYHALGALNIVRILGIFARLVTRDGKPRYAAFMPRLWRYLDTCLADPALADLKVWFDANVPASSRT